MRRLSMIACLGGLSLALAGAAAEEPGVIENTSEEDRPLVSDRPDFTESTETVAPGRIQIEWGYTFTYDSEQGERRRDHTAPELLIRVGLSLHVELRLGWEGYKWTSEKLRVRDEQGRVFHVEDSFDGANDVTIGMKAKFFEQSGLRPHLGLIAGVSLPSGSAHLTSGDVDPELVLAWAYDITDSFALAGNVGAAAVTEDGDRFFQSSASLSAALGLSDHVGVYFEYFGLYPNARRSDCAHSINGGMTFLMTEDFQLDARIGFGLNEEADDFFAGLGFVVRL